MFLLSETYKTLFIINNSSTCCNGKTLGPMWDPNVCPIPQTQQGLGAAAASKKTSHFVWPFSMEHVKLNGAKVLTLPEGLHRDGITIRLFDRSCKLKKKTKNMQSFHSFPDECSYTRRFQMSTLRWALPVFVLRQIRFQIISICELHISTHSY